MNYINDFSTRTDLIDLYGNNALLLYALQLRFSISDIVSVASDALTDGGDDKKCDLIYIDRDDGFAVIAQGYMKKDAHDTDLAPANKASDLNTDDYTTNSNCDKMILKNGRQKLKNSR